MAYIHLRMSKNNGQLGGSGGLSSGRVNGLPAPDGSGGGNSMISVTVREKPMVPTFQKRRSRHRFFVQQFYDANFPKRYSFSSAASPVWSGIELIKCSCSPLY